MKLEPHIEAAYDAATAILIDCSHEGGATQVNLGGGRGTTFACVACWNKHVAARKAARKLQIAAFNATIQTCEGPHTRPAPGRWTVAGDVHLCGRCKTKALRKINGNIARSGLGGLAMFGAFRLTREVVLGALK